MTLTGALVRIIWYLIKNQDKKRLCLKLEKAGDIKARDEKIQELVPEWANYMVNLMGNRKATVTVFGQENIPQDTAVVFIANHQGYLDIPVLLANSKKQMGFISKAEILKVPILSGWMKLMQCVFLKRNSPRQSVEAMNKAVETVKNGYSLVIFPEGHRSKGGPVQKFKAGSFKLAFRSEVPIVPVTIDGTWHLFEEKKKPNPGDIKLTFHPAISTKGLTKEEQATIPSKVQEIVESAL
ncbi:MAG: lysophospholipid acyltransferase family protein [Treponemataceae bacterium]|nr:lysophospholipid acyltransferase family protein [Treponemataceae bacterium]